MHCGRSDKNSHKQTICTIFGDWLRRWLRLQVCVYHSVTSTDFSCGWPCVCLCLWMFVYLLWFVTHSRVHLHICWFRSCVRVRVCIATFNVLYVGVAGDSYCLIWMISRNRLCEHSRFSRFKLRFLVVFVFPLCRLFRLFEYLFINRWRMCVNSREHSHYSRFPRKIERESFCMFIVHPFSSVHVFAQLLFGRLCAMWEWKRS